MTGRAFIFCVVAGLGLILGICDQNCVINSGMFQLLLTEHQGVLCFYFALFNTLFFTSTHKFLHFNPFDFLTPPEGTERMLKAVKPEILKSSTILQISASKEICGQGST